MGCRPNPMSGQRRFNLLVPIYVCAEPAQSSVQRLIVVDADTTCGAEVLRLDRSDVRRLLCRDRSRYHAADRIAVALGRRPGGLWPEWFTGALSWQKP